MRRLVKMVSLWAVLAMGASVLALAPVVAQTGDDAISNIAVGATASQSSTGFGGLAERAVDGNTDGRYSNQSVTHTASSDRNPWWQVDLGEQFAIEEVVLWNRTNQCCTSRLADFTLFVSDDPFDDDASIAQLNADPDVTAVFHPGELDGVSVSLEPGASGRYVRVQKPGGSALSLAEVQIFGTPVSQAPTCDGREATIVGTNGDDVIDGTSGDDVIVALGGDDVIQTAGGEDTICGGDGDDTIRGGADSDRLFGGPGDDTLFGQGGIDSVYGEEGDDTVLGGADSDQLFGGPGDDTMNGQNGNDFMFGEEGDDTLRGRNGVDDLDGGPGFDTLFGNRGAPDTCVNGEDNRASCEIIFSDEEPTDPEDEVPPTISIDSPTAGTITISQSGTLTINGTADDNDELSAVTVSVNAISATAVITAGSPSTWTLDVPAAPGAVVITATAIDAAGNTTVSDPVNVILEPSFVPPTGPSALATTSPFADEGGVALTRETILRFSTPIEPGSVAGAIDVSSNGSPITFTPRLSTDGLTVTLFYADDLPAQSTINVALDGATLRGVDGTPVDVDGDGAPGGTGTLRFDTLSITPVTGTSVFGRVFASELAATPDGAPIDVPLAGVTITVDGAEETLVTTTDASGNFTLDPAPAGRFFVHIDGRTATNAAPDGAYYPFVGKTWEAAAGQATEVGNIFLPLVPGDTLSPTSAIVDTEVEFSPSILADRPDLAGATLSVPAGSLYSDDGTVGGSVGIAPVDPDRLPGALPAGIEPAVVVTIQTDGPTNFDTPATLCLPNLPDSVTGQPLAAGEATALWSFNHDTGRFEVSASATVSDDGSQICTDPGQGVLAPGWHFFFNWVSGVWDAVRSIPFREINDAFESILLQAADSVIGLPIFDLKGFYDDILQPCTEVLATLGEGFDADFSELDGCGITPAIERQGSPPPVTPPEPEASRPRSTASPAVPVRNAVRTWVQQVRNVRTSLDPATNAATIDELDAIIVDAEEVLDRLDTVDDYYTYLLGNDWMSLTDDDLLIALLIVDSATDFLATSSDGGTTITDDEAAQLSALLGQTGPTQAELDAVVLRLNLTTDNYNSGIFRHADAAAGASLEWNDLEVVQGLLAAMVDGLQSEVDDGFEVADQRFFSIIERVLEALDQFGQDNGFAAGADVGETYVRIETDTEFVQRLQTGPSGGTNVNLPPESRVVAEWLDPATFDVGTQVIVTGPPGSVARRTAPYLLPAIGLPDTDGDGIHDIGESIVGTDPTEADTDGDGLSDAIELELGTDPLDGLLVQTGVLASIDTAGTAQDVAENGETVIVADGQAGVALFNTFQGMNPVLIGSIDTPGSADRVTAEGSRALVANGAGGAALLDIEDPTNPVLLDTYVVADLLGDATGVALSGDLAWVATESGGVVAIDITGGVVSAPTDIGNSAYDIAVQAGLLFVVTDDALVILDASSTPTEIGRVSVPGDLSPGTNRRSLFVGQDEAYVVSADGLTAVDISDVANPTVIATGPTGGGAWQDVALNGTGLAVGAASSALNLDNATSAVVYDVSDPTVIDAVVTQFATPGQARSVTIANGVAYVADGTRGLQVINYLAYDALGIAPTISLTSDTPNNEVSEGDTFSVFAAVTDDVQVRDVEFAVDGEIVATDGSFPFAIGIDTAALAGQSQVTVTAVATDTGGNSSTTSEVFTIAADTVAPTFVNSTPRSDVLAVGIDEITLDFDEAVVGFDDALLSLVELGADLALGGGDDTIVQTTASTAGQLLRIDLGNELPAGEYQLTAQPGALSDTAGNGIDEVVLEFSAIASPPAGTVVWISGTDGDWLDAFNWHSATVPTSDDDVVIDRAGLDLTVRVAGTATAATLTSTNNVHVDSGSLTLSDGASVIDGTFLVDNRTTFTATGAGTTFVATGAATIDGAQIRAIGGASVRIEGATTYNSDGGNGINEARLLLTADGANSVIDLPAVTSMSGVFGGLGGIAQLHRAINGGQILLPALTEVTGGGSGANGGGTYRFIETGGGGFDLQALESLNGTSAGIRFDLENSLELPALSSATLTDFNEIVDGSYSLPLLDQINSSRLRVNDGTTFNAPLLTESINSTIELDGASTLNIGSLTDITLSRIRLTDGATFALPETLTSYSSSGGHGINEQRTIFSADGAGTVLDLSALEEVEGIFGGLGSVRQFVTASNGGVIDLSGLTSLTGGGSGANGGGPFEIREQSGGSVLLDSLTTTTGSGAGVSLSFEGDTTLPSLETANGTRFSNAADSTLGLPALSSMSGSVVTATDGRSFLAPALTSFTSSSLTIGDTGSFETATLESIDQSSIAVVDGASFTTPASLTSYSSSRGHGVNEQRTLFSAQGSGSILDLSSLQTLDGNFGGLGSVRQSIVATEGAAINLSGVTSVSGGGTGANGGGPYQFRTADTASIDLSSLETVTGNGGQGVLFTNGGTMVIGTAAATTELTTANIDNAGELTTGNLNLTGTFDQTGTGTLRIDATGITPGVDFSQIVVSGTSTIDGAVEINPVSPYVPAAGDQLIIISGSGLTGSFATTTVTGLDPALAAQSVIDTTGASIEIN